MFDLSAFRLQDMALCSTTVRQLGEGATSLEETADRITRFLYTNLTTGPDEDPACVLIRAFKTHPYNRLTPELQALVKARLGDPPPNLDMKCLTLLASTGAISGWNNPALSSRFRVIPLAGPDALAQLPMFAQLFAQFHLDVPGIQDTSASLLLDHRAAAFNTFHVPDAVNSPYVPGQQDFVVPFGVQSVFGCGGLLPTGDIFALVLFAKVPVSKDTADLFRTIALSVKLALAPFEHSHLILPATPAASGSGNTPEPVALTALEDRVATLEAILAAQEHTVEVQSRRLEENLADAVRQGQKLQAQSARFETLSATSPVGIFESDAKGSCLYTNNTWQAITGLSLTDSLGDGWSRAIHEEDRSHVVATWSQTAKSDGEFSLEFRVRRPDGAIRWVHSRSRPLTNAAGLVTGYVGTMEDITERKQTEAALQQSEARLTQAICAAHIGIFDHDHRTDTLYWSPTMREILGVTAEEPASFTRYVDWIHPEDRDSILLAVHQAHDPKENGVFSVTHRLIRPDGQVRWVTLQSQTTFEREVPDERPLRTIGTMLDITAQRQAEADRLEQVQRLHAIVDHAVDGIITIDEQGLIESFNPAAERLFGYAADEAIGQNVKLLMPEPYHSEHDGYLANYQRTGQAKVIGLGREVLGRRKDGSVFPLELGVSETLLGARRLFTGIVRDITARKQAEAQFQQVVESAPNGILLVDPAGTISLVNTQIEQQFGYIREELLGQPVELLLPERFRPQHPGLRTAFFQAPTTRAMGAGRELYGRRKDGTEFPVDLGLNPLETPAGLQVLASVVDITARKQAEAQRQEQEARLRAIVDHAVDGIITIDEFGLIETFNPAAERLFGYAANETIGRNIKMLMPEPYQSEHDGYLKNYRHTGQAKIIGIGREVVGRRKDGSTFPLELGVSEMSSGGRRLFTGIVRDVTERVQMAAQLHLVIESAPTGLLKIDHEGQIIMVNAHTEELFGYQRRELLGQPVEILLPERFRARHPSLRKNFSASPSARAMGAGRDLAGRRKDGSEFPVELGLNPIDTPTGLQVLASIVDISARKQTESTRFRLQQAINHAQDGMALLDETGHYTYMNPAHATIYGYTADELLGHAWKELYHPEWAAMIEQFYLPTLIDEGQWQGEVVGKKKSGDAFHVDLALTLLDNPDTGHQTILCTCRDITHRKRMERDLIDAKEAAEAGVRTKSEFLATMSHEIRTPMNGVLGMTDLLIDTTLTPKQRDFVQTLKHSGESLMRIINDILDFSKIEAGKFTIESFPFDLRLTIEDTLDLLAPTAQAKQLELIGLIDGQAPNAVIGDPGHIRQILTNLIGNAIKFTEQGEVLVQVLKAEEEADSVLLRFEIVDTGVGLTEEAKTKLFQAFTQADSSTARKYGGTGLGLTICKRLTELMGGQIGIQSYPGTGTCVWFTIRLRTQPATAALPTYALVDNLRGLRICLVDDNATNRSLLQYHACDWKMHYESAEDGPSALALIRRAAAEGKAFDLAILDMHMPGMDGLELGRAIRDDAPLHHTRLILLTSLANRGDANIAQASGFSGYLTKPVRKHQLYDCLRLVMGQALTPPVESQAAPSHPPLITRHQVAEVQAQIRLLVVDDNPVNLKVAVNMLEKLGYRVDVAGNGNEALAALTRHRYNLVFMDCQMPELDGFAATRIIRTHEQPGTRLPIIAMTANAMEGDREHCLASGMDDFVSKPVRSQDLKAVLTQWLDPSDNRAAA